MNRCNINLYFELFSLRVARYQVRQIDLPKIATWLLHQAKSISINAIFSLTHFRFLLHWYNAVVNVCFFLLFIIILCYCCMNSLIFPWKKKCTWKIFAGLNEGRTEKTCTLWNHKTIKPMQLRLFFSLLQAHMRLNCIQIEMYLVNFR